MKYLINILFIFTILSCKAQNIIVPIGSGENLEHNTNFYLKDVNNEFNKYEGTWKYINGSTEIIFKFEKEEHYLSPSNYYRDLLVGEYQYIENGTEKVNTLLNFGNPTITGYRHNIKGSVFAHRLPSHCIDNSDISEIKIELIIDQPEEADTEGIVILRHVNENGVEKLQACIYDNTTMGDIPNARIDIPNGYYEFIKQ